ncbi:DUF3604 domain-containing protein [Gammaproteobacteria bacterium]|nr:DUF3604 domain-containing protein [Gammaproteobacteria bacterium]
MVKTFGRNSFDIIAVYSKYLKSHQLEQLNQPKHNKFYACIEGDNMYKNLVLAFILTLIYSCSEPVEEIQPDSFLNIAGARVGLARQQPIDWDSQALDPYMNMDPKLSSTRVPLFGDLHVHTTYSFDAYIFGTLATPDDAYEFAKGKPIKHPAGFDVSLDRPLDFYGVTDHGTFLGQVAEAATPGNPYYEAPSSVNVNDINSPENLTISSIPRRTEAFGGFLINTITALMERKLDISYLDSVSRRAWADTVAAAQRHNNPGKFTTFIGYEYTASTADMGNLHRNVIFKGNSNLIPSVPYSRANSNDPEGLWQWMDRLREDGIESLAIPHNSNGSDGFMFALEDSFGKSLTKEYAELRMRNEPIVEITQVKGTSDTHPALSTNDEWADFEIMPFKVATQSISKPKGSYVRDALLEGIKMEKKEGFNPYKFGFIGSSDTHTAASSQEEDNFFSKIGILDSSASLRGSIPETDPAILESGQPVIDLDGKKYLNSSSITWGAAGLAGVWAEENTRDSIYNAFRRKESFATSGPRMTVRFFAGYDLNTNRINDNNLIEYLYANAETMGADLDGIGQQTPSFFVWAVRDAFTAPLQRVQIIKGYIDDNGNPQEQVFDVACSDSGFPDPETYRCPDNNAKVDISTCAFSEDVGAAELKTFWSDPTFKSEQRAFYYVRALENPTCRWSTWDAVRNNVDPRSDMPKTIQERVWSSPIHYIP